MGNSGNTHPRLLAALVAAAVGLIAPGVAGVAGAVETTFELRLAPAAEALPPLPPPSVFPVQLVLDDDEIDGVFGVVAAGGARQFLWFNRFASPGTFTLEEIWVLFPAGASIAPGEPVQLVVYRDPDGDPTNGAELLTAFDVTIQAADDLTFSIYPLPMPLLVEGGGDVLIGVVDRFVQSGVTPPTAPAAIDTTTPQGRSWFAVWSGDPPNPPTLPADVLTSPVDLFIEGNWMIRAFGGAPPVQVIPTLGTVGFAALAALLALAALALMRRRGRSAPMALLAILAGLAGAAPAAAQVVIDDFSTAQGPLAVPPGTTASSAVNGAGILGSDRAAAIELVGGAGPVTLQVAAGDLTFDVTDSSNGTALVTWDADTDPTNLDPVGLGGVDLTAGNASALRLVAGSANDLVDAVIEVYTDGANSSVGALRVPVGAPQELFLSFSELVATAGTGANFTDVGAITLSLRATGATPSTSVTIELLDTVPPALAAAKVDALTVDLDSDGLADPGDTLTYTITITNPGGEALSVDLGDTVDPNTTLVGGSVSATPIAKGDQYLAVGNVTLMADGTPPRVGLLANDSDPDGDPITITAFDAVSANGGAVSLVDAATGTFDYTPAAGFRGVDTFTYTVEDDDTNTDVGTATINVQGIVWFVDNTNTGCGSPPCGDGTQADPFQTSKQAETASEADDVIRIREGDGTDAGHDQGFILKAGQRLVGGAADLLIGGTLIEAGAGHSVHSHAAGNVLDLAGDHLIEGMRLNPATGHGVAGTGSSNVTLDDVIVYTSGSAGGVSLTNHSGSFVFSNSMITSTVGTTGVAVLISGGSGLFAFSGSPVSHDGGGLIHVQNTTGGATVDFTGSNPSLTNGSDHGILLSNNTGGASFTFDAIGDVGTGSGDGIRIAGSGTVDLNTVGNLSATGGAALDVTGTTVVKAGGPGAITFASLASTGGAVGVNLNGVAPAVTVNGATTVSGAAGINLQSSGATTFTGQLGVTSTAGAAITANNNGLVSIPANTSTVSSTGGPGLDVTSTPLAISLATLSAAPGAGGRGVSLVGATGTVTSAGGTITGGTAGTAFHVDGGSPAVTHGGTVTQSNAQRVVNVEDTTGGAVAFNGKVTGGASSTGVRIDNADGNATFADLDLGTSGSPMTSTGITLSGGSAGTFSFADTQVFTSGATGLDANNGGVVQVTGAGNRVTTSTGIAVRMIGGTTIGGNEVTFERVDASGSTHGIRLSSAGSGFNITGVGTTDGSGGTIQNVSQRGIEVLSTDSISLSNMTLTNAATANGPGPCPDAISGGANTGCNAPIHLQEVVTATLINVGINGSAQHGLNGWRVTDLTLNNSTILNAGNEVGENGAKLFNLFGTSTIDGTTIDNSFRDNLRVQNDDNTQLTLTIDNSFFTDSVGGLGVHFSGRGSSRMDLVFEDSQVTGNGSSGIQPQGSDDTTASGGSFDFRIRRVVFENNAAAAIDMGAVGQSPLYFEVMDNGTAARPLTNHGSHVINVNQGGSPTAPFTTATVDGIISGNFIGSGPNSSGTTAGSGIRLVENQSGTVRVRIENNTVKGWTEHGIFVIARDAAGGPGSGSSQVDVTIQGNTVNDPNGAFPIAGIKVQGGAANLADEIHDICATIGENASASERNVVTVGGFPEAGIRVQQRFNTTMSLFQGASVSAAAATVLGDNNTITATPPTNATGTVPVVNTACALPVTPP